MSWQALIKIIEQEAGSDVAMRIEERARIEIGGTRITVAKRQKITAEMIDNISHGNHKQAAAKLGVHISTVYRIQHRKLIR